MKVTVTFHAMDDLCLENRNRIEGVVLTTAEAELAEWNGRVLTYRTDRSASEVVSDWEDEGFEISEFAGFAFSA